MEYNRVYANFKHTIISFNFRNKFIHHKSIIIHNIKKITYFINSVISLMKSNILISNKIFHVYIYNSAITEIYKLNNEMKPFRDS